MMPGMTTLQIPIGFPIFSSFSGARTNKRCGLGLRFSAPTSCCSSGRRNIAVLLRNGFKMQCPSDRWPYKRDRFKKYGILMRNGINISLVAVRASGLNGGGWDSSSTTRALVNLVLAIGLTYLTITGQLGWVLDAIVSIWLLAVLLPIVGLVAFFWFAGRDIVQSSCPNCGNNLNIFKSSLQDGLQVCPFCSRPFSVQGDKFVRESDGFSSNSSPSSGQVFNDFFSRPEKGKATSTTTVDIEAEVKDID